MFPPEPTCRDHYSQKTPHYYEGRSKSFFEVSRMIHRGRFSIFYRHCHGMVNRNFELRCCLADI